MNPLNPLRPVLLTAAGLVENVTNVTQVVLDTAVINVAEGTGDLAVVCFAAGTIILTSKGPRRIEDLRPGDQALTRDNGFQPIRWIGHRLIDHDVMVANPHLRPIRIKADALGANCPSADLIVSPQHRILVRSAIAERMFGAAEVLVAAKQLLELPGVESASDMDEVDYFHILFDRHEIVLSNGTEAESLFTGEQALKSVGKQALEEIFLILPELRDESYVPVSARSLPTGRQARRLVSRHARNGKPIVTSPMVQEALV
ncbi:Hint domain-containing protein [Paracoccus caeni]|uniref:Hint domain-containing protein n=2 Tax=Paracoccus caeni TaxID=657651 RepID=A0A934SGH9_9RHOB|nr:Hint domain-containing protein [Paracoccus caeni]